MNSSDIDMRRLLLTQMSENIEWLNRVKELVNQFEVVWYSHGRESISNLVTKSSNYYLYVTMDEGSIIFGLNGIYFKGKDVNFLAAEEIKNLTTIKT